MPSPMKKLILTLALSPLLLLCEPAKAHPGPEHHHGEWIAPKQCSTPSPNGVIHSVPDAGSTVMLLGMALSALGIVRKFRS